METNWDVIKSYIGASLWMMIVGLIPLIPLGGIYIFGFWLFYLLGVNKTDQFGPGTTVALVLIYAFSIGLWTTYVQRRIDREQGIENKWLSNSMDKLSHDDWEINRRVSKLWRLANAFLVDRLEDPDSDDNNVGRDTVALINDIRMELEFIRDKQFVRYSGHG